MSKKLTIFLMGVFAMILATAPAQAQSLKDRIAKIRSQQTMRKYSPVMNNVREAKMAELKAAHPKLFRGHGIKPAQKNNNLMQMPLSMRPFSRFNTADYGTGQILMAADGTSLIANVTYFPGIQYANERTISRFSPSAPTTMETLATGSYTFFNGAAIQDGIYYGVYLNLDYYEESGG